MTFATNRFAHLFLLAIFLVLPVSAWCDHPRLTLGVFPHLSPIQIEKRFTPIAKDLERSLGVHIKIVTSSTMERFNQRLDRGEFDIAFVQPFDYVRMAKSDHYQPLVRISTPLQALFIVAPDAPFQSLADLKNERIAMPPRNSAASRLAYTDLVKAHPDQNGDTRVIYAGSHSSCIQMLYANHVGSCATVATIADLMTKKMGKQYRTIHRSNELPHALFVVANRHADTTRARLIDLMTKWSDSEAGREILKQSHFSGFVTAYDNDYDPVRTYPLSGAN